MPENENKIEQLGQYFKKFFLKNKNSKNRNLLENKILDIYGCSEYKNILISYHPKGRQLLNG